MNCDVPEYVHPVGLRGQVSILAIGLPDRYLRRLAKIPRLTIYQEIEPASRAKTSVLLYWDTDRSTGRYVIERLATNLKWVHVPWVGVEGFITPKIWSGEILLSNSRGSSGPAVSEFVIAAILSASKELPRHIKAMQSAGLGFTPTREIRGQSLLIVGLGDIGKSVALHARHFGMRVRAVTRTPAYFRPCEYVGGIGQLDQELGTADYVVICAPLTMETRGMFDRRRLGLMSPTAWLINVARGEIVRTEALIEILADRRIGGAILDVVDPEPLGTGSPLWAIENAVLTPHISSWTEGRFDRSFEIFEKNLINFRRGRPLANQIDIAGTIK